MKVFYEYKVIELIDDSGKVDIGKLTNELNYYGKDGWRLVTAYTNELGKNALSIAGIGINSTADQNVLILEREIKDDRFDDCEQENASEGYEIVRRNGRVFALKGSDLLCPKCHAFIDSESKSMCPACGISLME